MPPKPFSLDVVLKVRKRKEDLAHQKFMQALTEQQEIEKKLIAARTKQKEIIQILENKQQEGILAVELSRLQERITYGQEEMGSLQKLLHEKKQISEKKRALLIEKSRDYKVLQELKERQNRAWKQYVDKKEANMLDEIAILHHDRPVD
jgi:flagellar protein FliJ